jgi:hypothetical protein
MRHHDRRILIGLAIAGVAGAVLIMPAIYFFGLWLAPRRPVPSLSHVPPTFGDAIWARADGGRATELQPINPISFVRMRTCRALAARTDDPALRGARRAECMKLLPAIQAVDYLSSVHMRDEQVPAGNFRHGISQFVTAAWLTRSWTKAELVDTLAERGGFGFGWRGADLAARRYFARPLDALTLPQSALLAAFIGDRNVDPWCHPAAAAEMRTRILDRMRENGAIDQATFETAAQSGLALTEPPRDHQACKG